MLRAAVEAKKRMLSSFVAVASVALPESDG
jgi:hypothetical protein